MDRKETIKTNTASDYELLTEELLKEDFHVIDFLPVRVPEERGSRYFEMEEYLRKGPFREELYRKFARIVLKLSCYFEPVLSDGSAYSEHPSPRELYEKTAACPENGMRLFLFPTEQSLLTLSGDDLYMTLYRPGGELGGIVRHLAESEGLFFREGMKE